MFSDEMRNVRELTEQRWPAIPFQSHAAVQELSVPEDRFHSKPEKKLL